MNLITNDQVLMSEQQAEYKRTLSNLNHMTEILAVNKFKDHLRQVFIDAATNGEITTKSWILIDKTIKEYNP